MHPLKSRIGISATRKRSREKRFWPLEVVAWLTIVRGVAGRHKTLDNGFWCLRFAMKEDNKVVGSGFWWLGLVWKKVLGVVTDEFAWSKFSVGRSSMVVRVRWLVVYGEVRCG
ncbi:unnamed protein product [Dovyalis caffra]|uniref:Uncharacterized protein n=1 Tax=Dovyalis caffra TaxID=77055 RepID=A0AAV1SCH8_9ROSI|nr:unnamed protein product [Dovyalis caffra]